MQGLQVRRINRARSTFEQSSLRRRFGKGNDVAQRIGLRQEHDNAVETEGKAAVRGGPCPEPLQQKSKPLLRLLLRYAEQGKNSPLEGRIGDPEAAPTQFGPVQDHVVSQGP